MGFFGPWAGIVVVWYTYVLFWLRLGMGFVVKGWPLSVLDMVLPACGLLFPYPILAMTY